MPNTLPTRPRPIPYNGGIEFGVIPARYYDTIVGPEIQIQPVGPPSFPPPPSVADWIGPITNWSAMGNDSISDCVTACMGHVIESWTGAASTRVVIPDQDVIALYSTLTGYNGPLRVQASMLAQRSIIGSALASMGIG